MESPQLRFVFWNETQRGLAADDATLLIASFRSNQKVHALKKIFILFYHHFSKNIFQEIVEFTKQQRFILWWQSRNLVLVQSQFVAHRPNLEPVNFLES